MRAIAVVMGKDLLETIRDPHVLMFLLFPIAIYPLMLWAATQLGTADAGWREQQSWRIDAAGPAPLVDALLEGNTPATGGIDALDEGEVDLVVQTQIDEEAGAERWQVTLTHIKSRARSRAALVQAQKRLQTLRQERLYARAAAAGLDRDALEPLKIRSEVSGGNSELFRWLTGLIVAVLLPTTLLMSGLYPAIDIVVGERERGTIETTMVTAVPRWVLGLGRICATLVFEGIGMLGNLVGISLTASSLSVSMTANVREIWIPPLSFLLALPALTATAFCVTGALLISLLPARTFKEGEWLGSGVLLCAVGLLVAAVPGLVGGGEPGLVLFLPIANTTIALARAMEGTLTWTVGIVPVIVNGGLGMALLFVAARVTASEEWLFSDRLPRWLSWVRRGMPG